jgi:hypothetical protein
MFIELQHNRTRPPGGGQSPGVPPGLSSLGAPCGRLQSANRRTPLKYNTRRLLMRSKLSVAAESNAALAALVASGARNLKGVACRIC